MEDIVNISSLQENVIQHLLKNLVHIDIFGCCVSRDVFGINPEKYKIELFLQNISPISVTKEHYFQLTYSDFDQESINPGFIKWQIAEINGTVQKSLNESLGEWLVLDFRPLTNPCCIISNNNAAQIITETEFTPLNMKLLSKYDPSIKINPFTYSIKDCYHAIDTFFKIILNKYKNRIIYLELYDCCKALDNQGAVISIEHEDERINLENAINKYVKKYYSNQVYYVEFPKNTLADQCHPWGLYPVHMISEYYEYAKKAIDIIILNNNKNCNLIIDLQGSLKQLKNNYEKIINEITAGARLSNYNSRTRALYCIKNNNLFEAICIANKMIQNHLYDGYAVLGSIAPHFSGITAKFSAPRYYYMGIAHNSRYSRQSLYQYLKSENQPELYPLLIYYAYQGDPEAMGELAIINRQKSIDSSRFWIKCATKFGLSGFKKYSFDILWTNDDEKDYQKLYNIALDMAQKSNGEGFARLGLLYKRGVYVSKDLTKAEYYLRLALGKKVLWVETDLFDTLWEINDPSKYNELVSLAKKLSNDCNYEGSARLGLLYKYGRGVKQDLLKAENLFK